MGTITPTEVAQRRRDGRAGLSIDVRTPMEYREVHVPEARLIPLDEIDAAAVAAMRQRDEPVYVFCRTGSRAQRALEKLEAQGVQGCHVVEGGLQAWTAAALPLVRGKKGVSLERQVRIAAGALVLVGAVLAWTVHPAAVGLCAFVGAGLVFAGITDWCGMGLLLARMPWNRGGADGCPTGQVPANPGS